MSAQAPKQTSKLAIVDKQQGIRIQGKYIRKSTNRQEKTSTHLTLCFAISVLNFLPIASYFSST